MATQSTKKKTSTKKTPKKSKIVNVPFTEIVADTASELGMSQAQTEKVVRTYRQKFLERVAASDLIRIEEPGFGVFTENIRSGTVPATEVNGMEEFDYTTHGITFRMASEAKKTINSVSGGKKGTKTTKKTGKNFLEEADLDQIIAIQDEEDEQEYEQEEDVA
jgi:nucleoid DNA-binding protein